MSLINHTITVKLTCEVTGNACGTDPWKEYKPCICKSCQEWMWRRIEQLETACVRAEAFLRPLDEKDHSLEILNARMQLNMAIVSEDDKISQM